MRDIIISEDIIIMIDADGEMTVFNMFKPKNNTGKPDVIISGKSVVGKIAAYVPSTISGDGSVSKVEAHAGDVEIDKGLNIKPQNVTVAEDVSVIKDGDTIIGTSGNTNSGSTSGNESLTNTSGDSTSGDNKSKGKKSGSGSTPSDVEYTGPTYVKDVTFPSSSSITYGDKLSDSTLSVTSDAHGAFAWTDGSVTPTVTNSGYSVTYTPKNLKSYNYSAVPGWDPVDKVVRRDVNITVNKKRLTTTVDDKNIKYNENSPDFTYTLSGFVNNDKASAVSDEPDFACIYEKGVSGVGEYDIIITPGKLSAENYSFNMKDGTMYYRWRFSGG